MKVRDAIIVAKTSRNNFAVRLYPMLSLFGFGRRNLSPKLLLTRVRDLRSIQVKLLDSQERGMTQIQIVDYGTK
jgi:hypothetical protein